MTKQQCPASGAAALKSQGQQQQPAVWAWLLLCSSAEAAVCNVCKYAAGYVEIRSSCDFCSTYLMAYCRVFRVSSVEVGSGVMHAIMQVWALPPMESCRQVAGRQTVILQPIRRTRCDAQSGLSLEHRTVTGPPNSAGRSQKVQQRTQPAAQERISQKQMSSQACSGLQQMQHSHTCSSLVSLESR